MTDVVRKIRERWLGGHQPNGQVFDRAREDIARLLGEIERVEAETWEKAAREAHGRAIASEEQSAVSALYKFGDWLGMKSQERGGQDGQ